MKRISLLALATLFAGSVVTTQAADVAFSWDFSGGLEGFTTYDIDQRTPNTAASDYGFAVDVAWQDLEIVDKNPAAVSNSSHSPMGAAEDWLITPAITVGEGQALTFRACTYSLSSTARVGKFDVKVSTTGTAVEDFTDVLATAASTKSAWEKKTFDMSAYAGKTVYVAIVNKALAKDFLVIDDIFVGVPPVGEVTVEYTHLQADASAGQRISGKVTMGGVIALDKYTATLTCGDFTTSRTYEGLNVSSTGTHAFMFNESLPTPTAGEPQNFTVTILVNDEHEFTTSGEILTQAYQPTKRVVAEETTGTWCGFCPGGIVAMEDMHEKYPDTFIGIAVHGDDIMAVDNYLSYMYIFTEGLFPQGVVMRKAVCDPTQFETYYKQRIHEPAWADISVTAEWTDDTYTALKTVTNTKFATSAEELGMRLALVIIENDVHGTTSSYNQSNYYSGGRYGEMGGWENKPDPVPAKDMYYQEVARHIYDDPEMGIKGSLPNQVTRDVDYKFSRELEMPNNVLVPENCEVVAMLLDSQTGAILNAAKCKINTSEAVESVKGDALASKVYSTSEGIRVELQAGVAQTSVNVYALDGTLVYSTISGDATINCPVNGRGVYLVRIDNNGSTQTHKVIL